MVCLLFVIHCTKTAFQALGFAVGSNATAARLSVAFVGYAFLFYLSGLLAAVFGILLAVPRFN